MLRAGPHATQAVAVLTRLLRRFLRPYARQVALVVVLLVGQTAGNLYLPTLNADIINRGVITGDLGYILRIGGIMLAITLAVVVLAITGVYWSSRVAMGTGADLRAAVFRRVQAFSQRDLDRFGTPSLITRNTNDVQQVQLFLQMALTLIVVAPIMAVGGVILAVHESAALSPLLAVAVPVMAAFFVAIFVRVVPRFRTVQSKLDRINLVLREQITGVRVIRAFRRSGYEAQRFGVANDDLTATTLSVNRIFALALPTLMLILNLTSVAAMYFGGRLVAEGRMPIGNLIAFLTYIAQILIAVMMAAMVAILLPRAVASAERIEQVLDTEPSITDPPNPVIPSSRSGEVVFDGVSFAYPGSEQPVLCDLSFTLRPGETSAVIGGTGSGKSTLIQLICRFFDPTAGRVLVNGVDVRQQQREALWSGIGLVPQAGFLFRGTVASNLRLGRADATDAELWHALQVAQAADFVSAMPGGLDGEIDQGGTNVSGGQRQRLSIARAIVRQPGLYLFDDAFSALDAGTDARLRARLAQETQGATVLIVAQRVSTIMHADRILVLDGGTLAGIGTHAELMRTTPAYREIVISQLGEESAA